MRIYKVTNLTNGKTYVGKTTKTLDERMIRHSYDARYETAPTYFHKALLKYGVESFRIELLEECGGNGDEQERHWIAELHPNYNLTAGGGGGDTSRSPNFQAAMKRRDISGLRNPMFGRRNSHPVSPETCERIRQARCGKPHPHKGTTHSVEARRRISESLKRFNREKTNANT
jgi:group I intron endonuclease